MRGKLRDEVGESRIHPLGSAYISYWRTRPYALDYGSLDRREKGSSTVKAGNAYGSPANMSTPHGAEAPFAMSDPSVSPVPLDKLPLPSVAQHI